MTAGRGITHSERFDGPARDHGGTMHGLQAWVALPDAGEEVDPGFAHREGDADLPCYETAGLKARLIAGTGFGARAAVPVSSPLVYAHWELGEGARAGFPPDHPERAIYVAAGRIEVEGHAYGPHRMLVLGGRDTVAVRGLEPSTVMLLGGEPVGPRHIDWNFVSSSKGRIEQAKADWRAGRFALPPRDRDEWIPLPQEPPPAPADAMS